MNRTRPASRARDKGFERAAAAAEGDLLLLLFDQIVQLDEIDMLNAEPVE